MMARKESGIQFLARLGSRPSLKDVEPRLFQDGLDPRDVVEFYGSEGTGKTETLLHITACCLLTQTWKNITLNGKNAGVIFLDTDYKFSVLRLATILEQRIVTEARLSQQENKFSQGDLEAFIQECLKKLHVLRCSDSSQMVASLHGIESIVCDNPEVSVVMLDSLSAFYWIDRNNAGDNISAQETNLKLAIDVLMKLVSNYNLILIATKSAYFKKKSEKNNNEKRSAGDNTLRIDFDAEHTEFLSKSWQRSLTHRLVFFKQDSTETDTEDSSTLPCFIVGGDYLATPSRFTISNAGISFLV